MTATRTVRTKSFAHGQALQATPRGYTSEQPSEKKACRRAVQSAQKAFELSSERSKLQGKLEMYRRAIEPGGCIQQVCLARQNFEREEKTRRPSDELTSLCATVKGLNAPLDKEFDALGGHLYISQAKRNHKRKQASPSHCFLPPQAASFSLLTGSCRLAFLFQRRARQRLRLHSQRRPSWPTRS